LHTTNNYMINVQEKNTNQKKKGKKGKREKQKKMKE
jgi:hypothetical protein